MDHYDLVERAYAELMTTGQIYASDSEAVVNEQKALMTRRAAYYLKPYGYWLLSKTSGNNILGLSVDCVVLPSGEFYDIATDVAIANSNQRIVSPVNAGPQFDAALVARRVEPTAALAGLEGPVTPPSTPDWQRAIDDVKDSVDRWAHAVAQMKDSVTKLEANFAQLCERVELLQLKLEKLPSCTEQSFETGRVWGHAHSVKACRK